MWDGADHSHSPRRDRDHGTAARVGADLHTAAVESRSRDRVRCHGVERRAPRLDHAFASARPSASTINFLLRIGARAVSGTISSDIPIGTGRARRVVAPAARLGAAAITLRAACRWYASMPRLQRLLQSLVFEYASN
jgi:hypothetical protein